MDWGAVIWLILGILGAAFIVGGIVAYRGSTRTSVRAFSAAAIAAGVVMWAVILITVPVSRTGDGPQEPTVTKVEALNAALREANIQLPDYVEVVKVDALATPAVDI